MPLSPGSWTVVDPQPADAVLPPLITPADVEAFTRGKLKANTPGLEASCAAVSRAVRDECGWHIAPVLQVHDLIDGPGGKVLHLPTRYLRSVEALRWRGDALAADSYRWNVEGWVEYDPHTTSGWPWPSLGSWPTGFRTLDVEFTHGYAKTPEALLQTMVGIAARNAASPLGYTREQAGQVSVGFGGAPGAGGGIALLEAEKQALVPYRIVGV